MCTVTMVRHPRGFRLVCNRDESRDRAGSLPPALHDLSGRRALFPLDPESGGTWMGVNDAGLLACLLNAYPHPAPLATGVRSRGIIVPDLLPLGTLDDMAAAALALDASLFSPFRLLLANGSETLLISAGPSRPRIEHARTDEPAIMLTSSGLGDHIVESHRRALFEFIFASDRDPLHAQSVFHRNRSEHEPHLSVSMSRTGARTLSRTTVDFDHASFSMNHLPLAEDGSSVTQGLTRRLPLAPSNVPRATADVYA